MRNTFKLIITSAAAVLLLGSCIEEYVPESATVTTQQLSGSSSALTAAISGLPAQFTPAYLIFGSDEQCEFDMGFPQFNMQLSEIMGDIFVQGSNSGYDWFNRWNRCLNMDAETDYAQVPWYTLYAFVKSANDIVASIDEETADANTLGNLGLALAFRAMEYTLLMTIYEPVENSYTDISEVKGLTVPIVTDKTEESVSKNNPRAKHADLVALIESDLNKAEEYLAGFKTPSGMYPSLAVVYGLKARLYMIEKNWAEAQKYARKAIDTSGATPLTQDEWENPTSGFCDATANSSWMWFVRYSAENMGNLCNWTGWVSAEADWGYNSLCFFGINRWLYERIPETDFRKHSFLDPEKSAYYAYKTCREPEYFEETCPPYTAIKFRCKGGDWENFSVGGASDLPLMRVEEMYLIEAEAIGMQNLAEGKAALENFMKTYRDPEYTFAPKNIAKGIVEQGAPGVAADVFEFQEEVFFQKRIEFWGEGTVTFADYKRIQPGNYQAYEGTNAPGADFYLNCDRVKPNCTLVIPRDELDSNVGIVNNPDPSSKVTPVTL